jgi:hypothetical protein
VASTSQNSVFEAAPATQSAGPSTDIYKKSRDSPTVFAPNDSTSSVRRGSIEQPHRTYKIRWFGLVVLTLLNVMVSWSVFRSCNQSAGDHLAHKLVFTWTELYLVKETTVY